ncbi:MAG: AI-2E family transporter, partial [Tolypothrix sp. T3-bin4]|nr:AI-2E family transporter [Tolypothrix sp. T3-bin4]
MPKQRLTVSLVNVLLVVATGLLLVLLWQLRGLLVTLMIAVVLAAALAPIIEKAQTLRIPRWLAVLVVYLGLIAILTGVGLLIGPAVIEQIERLIRRLPTYLEVVRSLFDNLIIRLGMSEPNSDSPIGQLFNTQALTGWAIRSSQQLVVRSYSVTRG